MPRLRMLEVPRKRDEPKIAGRRNLGSEISGGALHKRIKQEMKMNELTPRTCIAFLRSCVLSGERLSTEDEERIQKVLDSLKEPDDAGELRLVSFSQDYGRMGDLDGLFVCDADEWKSLQALIKHEVPVYFGEVLGKHSEIYGPIKAGDISVQSEDQSFCREFRRLKLNTGYSPLDYFDEDRHWEQTYDEETKMGQVWPPNEDGTFNWKPNGE